MPTDRRAFAVALASVCAFIGLYPTQALLPMLVEQFAATPAMVSRTVSASTFAVALVAPITGALSDRVGRKRIIVAAAFLLVVPTLFVATAQSLGEMVFWRFVQGLLLPPIFAVTIAYIGEECGAAATGVTGIYVAASGIGGFLGRFVTGLVAEHFGWRAGFLALALVVFACACGVAILLPRERRFVRSSSISAALGFLVEHLTNTRLIATYAVGFGVLFCFVAVFTYINFVLAAPPYGLTSAALGTIFVVYLVGVPIAPLSGRLVARFGRARLVAATAGFWVLGLALTVAGGLPLILLGLAVCAGCGFVCQSSATSFVALNARHARSLAVGLYVSFYYIGGSAGAALGGLAWTFAGWPGCVAAVACVVAFIAVAALAFWRDQMNPER